MHHVANVYEIITDAVPGAAALVHGGVTRTWAEYDDRAARLANVFARQGLNPDSKIAICAYNSNEYLEAQYAAFKMRGVPINVNYRYFESELIYLFDNADVEALVYQAHFADRIAAICEKLPKLKLLIEIDDGTGGHIDGALPYEDAIAGTAPMSRIERSADDIYMLYTGGTTGMPKGVMYRHGDFTEGLKLVYDIRGLPRAETAEALAGTVKQLIELGAAPRTLPACPLMHGTGMWLGAMAAHSLGGAAVTNPNMHFDPHILWQTVEDKKVTDMAIVGDAFAKPMLSALEAGKAGGGKYDLSSLVLLISSGVMFTTEVKRGLLEFGDFTIIDTMGSTEGGMGSSSMNRQTPESKTAKFEMNETTKVFTEDGREVEPGSGEIGMVASGGMTPIGYFKDPEKSAATFREVGGARYSFPGDFAKVEADGTLVLLGRGSQCINTGGEKVFPEEVEEAVKSHPSIYDCLVVGIPDDRFGERVTAVLSFKDSENQITEPELIDWMHGKIAGFKIPRAIVTVATVQRAANGKADYKWAKQAAIEYLKTG